MKLRPPTTRLGTGSRSEKQPGLGIVSFETTDKLELNNTAVKMMRRPRPWTGGRDS